MTSRGRKDEKHREREHTQAQGRERRGKTFYWDVVQQVAAQERPEMLKVMTKSRAKSVLGVGLKGEPVENIAWGTVYRSFRREFTKALEFGTEDEKSSTLRDCHEAYQVLIKDAKPCTLKKALDLHIREEDESRKTSVSH